MAASTISLPEGFEIDNGSVNNGVSVPSGFEIEKDEKKKGLAETIGVPQWVEDVALGQVAEVARGFFTGVESMANKLDAISDFATRTIGAPKNNFFQEWESQVRQTKESIPDTSQNPFNKFVFQAVGQAVPVAVEFALTRGGNIAKFATLEAVNEYGNQFGDVDPTSVSDEIKALAKGGASGATIAAAFPVAGKVLQKSADMLAKGYKSAAEKFVQFVTKDKDLAKDFVNNPNKYPVSPFAGGIKTYEEAVKENLKAREQMKLKHQYEKDAFAFKQQTDSLALKENLVDQKNKLLDAKKATEESILGKRKESLDALINKNKDAIESSNEHINIKATSILDSALSKFNALKKQKGEAVEMAIKLTQESNPGFAFPHSIINNALNSSLKSGGFKIEKGVVKPITAARLDSSDIRLINAIKNEISSMKEDGVSLIYAQELKTAANERATAAYDAGKNKLGVFWSNLADGVNPVNIIKKNKSYSDAFPEIAKANKDFSTFMQSYSRAMSGFFRDNAVGQKIPDVNKALNAFKRSDKATIREMEIADLALPKEDRILPAFKGLMKDADDLFLMQKSNVKTLRAKFDNEIKEFRKAATKVIRNLSVGQGRATLNERQRNFVKMRDFLEEKDAEYLQLDNKLKEVEKFYEGLEKLRSFRPQPETSARVVQQILGYGSVLPAVIGEGGISGKSAVGFGLLSPAISTPIIKGTILGGGAIKRGAERIIGKSMTRGAQRVIGRQILSGDE